MNLEQLRYFIDVCETGNISQSAKKFYISPQGMNKSLRSLEKELGIELFVFQQRKTEMSELGKLYYTQIKDLVHQLTKINEDISMKQAKTLKVALSNNTYSMVSQMINSFMQTYPQITITLSEYPDKLVEEKLLAQEVDIAFLSGPIFNTQLRSARLFTDVNKLCIPKGHRLEGREYVTFQDLANEPFLAMNENYKIYDCYIIHMQMCNAVPNIVYCGCSMEAMKKMVEDGVGITMANPQYVFDSEKIVQIPMRNKNPWQLNIALGLRPNNQVAEQFFHFIQEAARPYNQQLDLVENEHTVLMPNKPDIK